MEESLHPQGIAARHQDDAAVDLVPPLLVDVDGAVSQVHELGLDLATDAVREGDAFELLLDGGGDLELRGATGPAREFEGFVVGVLDAVALELLHHPFDGGEVAGRATEPAAVDVAKDLQVIHRLGGGIDL